MSQSSYRFILTLSLSPEAALYGDLAASKRTQGKVGQLGEMKHVHGFGQTELESCHLLAVRQETYLIFLRFHFLISTPRSHIVGIVTIRRGHGSQACTKQWTRCICVMHLWPHPGFWFGVPLTMQHIH